MSLLYNILARINSQGGQILSELGEKVNELNEADEGPFDGPNRPSDLVCNLAQRIVTDCQELISLLVPSHIQTLQYAFSGALPAALAVVAHFNVADTIESLGGHATATEIAQTVGTDAIKMAHTLRALTAFHIFIEESDGRFANNRGSRPLFSDGGGAAMIESYSQISGKALVGWLPLMQDRDMMHEVDPQRGAFSKAYGSSISIMDWMMAPENEDDLITLMEGIPWLTQVSAKETVDNFDWTRWGVGLRNLESMVPAQLAAGEIEIVLQDYLLEQQSRADIYWMRGVLHDYSDNVCVKILENLKSRMLESPKTRILINEIVVPSLPVTTLKGVNLPTSESKPRTQSSFVEMTSLMQLHSVAFQGGYERTYPEYQKIFDRAGYQVVNFYQLQLYTSIMELAPKF
ncbi:hypothetical protein FE257_006448 [Aspergillus nanangensis]|uniref:O-methyltransferase domain-containing protein n=1 Tax=Aspergillus nanangensis TaxID=2582783 RepID=A0AAD4CY16_ASPNN|nr:hypothetical protein FE257_006448 [Aspergillus nanangensis]